MCLDTTGRSRGVHGNTGTRARLLSLGTFSDVQTLVFFGLLIISLHYQKELESFPKLVSREYSKKGE